MAWVTVTPKTTSNNQTVDVSIEGLASDVYMSDGRAASAALTTIATQAATLNTNIIALTAAINAITPSAAS